MTGRPIPIPPNTDNEIFDDLFEEYNNTLNQRTWNYSIADKLLRSKAFQIQSQIEKYLEKKVNAGETLTDEMINFEDVASLETKNKLNPIPQDAYIPPADEEIQKHIKKKETKPKPPHKPKPPTPPYGEDYDSIWECALDIRKKIVTGAGFSKDMQIFAGYDWAVENCTVKGKPISSWLKLKNGYENGKMKTKTDIIIAKFEEDYYD